MNYPPVDRVTVEHAPSTAPVTPPSPSETSPDGEGTPIPVPGHVRSSATGNGVQAPAGGVAAREGKPKTPRPPAGFHTGTAATMSEDRGRNSLDWHVRKLIRDLGLLGYHTKDSRGSREGYPDWTIVGHRVLFRELKREGKDATAAQAVWLAKLTAAGEDADVWRPSDLYSGRIGQELAAISRLGRAA